MESLLREKTSKEESLDDIIAGGESETLNLNPIKLGYNEGKRVQR